MDVDPIFSFLGKILAYGGGAAVIAYGIFQFLGKSWIENKFAERLEQMRHDQALELQRLRVEIDSLLSGAIKLQEREFEILPRAWEILDEAHVQIQSFVSPMEEYPNVDRMSPEQLEELLGVVDFSNTEKMEIRNASNKLDKYREISFYHRLHKARITFREFQTYVARNGIFFESELKEKLEEISQLLWESIVDKEVGREAKDWKMQREGWNKIRQRAEPLYKEIGEYIQTRLQSHGRRL